MNTISVLIIDDEEPAGTLIKQFLKNQESVNLVGEASNGFEGIKMIKELRPALIFLDIQMPKLNGFEMLELIDHPPLVIFSTAYDQYAIKAFEMHAVDYLLKPFSKERFDNALAKAIRQIQNGQQQPDYSALQTTIHQQEHLVRIAVKHKQEIHVISVNDLTYIESFGDYVKLHSKKGIFLKEKTMKYFEEYLPPKQFVRIHRSYLVNVEEIVKVEIYDKETYRVYLKDQTVLKASNNGYKLLKQSVQL